MGKSTFNERDFVEAPNAGNQGFELRGRFQLFLDVLSQVANDMAATGTSEHEATSSWLEEPHLKKPDGTLVPYLSFDLFCDMVDANDRARDALRSHLHSQPEVIAQACLSLQTTGTDTDFERMRIVMGGLDEPITQYDTVSDHRIRERALARKIERSEGPDEQNDESDEDVVSDCLASTASA